MSIALLEQITRMAEEPGDIAVRFSGMSNADYHKAPGTSHSQSTDLAECPELFYENHLGPNQPEWKKTEAKAKGSAVHTITLEGRAAFKREYIYEPVFAGVGSKKAREDWKKANIGKVTFNENWRADVEGMSRRILRLREFKGIRNGSEFIEEAFFVRDKDTYGELVKAKFDIINPGLLAAGDVKTSGTGADLESFSKAVITFFYGSQAAWYLEILKRFPGFEGIRDFVFFVVGSTEPYLAASYRLDPGCLEIARGAVLRRLATLAECRSSNVWPGYNNNELTDLQFSSWQIKNLAR